MIALDYLSGALTGGAQPDAIGKKFAADGTVLTDPGCTTICHVDPSSPAFAALTRAQEALKAGPFAKDFAFLPPASFHMTIFDAFIESGRSRERVPAHLPEEATVNEIIEDASARVEDLVIAQEFQARPVGIFGGFSVSMTGKNAAAEQLLRKTRDQLSDTLKIRKSDHDAYRFHITLAYNLRWFQPYEALQIIALSDQVGRHLVEEIEFIDLGPVEFCSFETMHHFEPLKLL